MSDTTVPVGSIRLYDSVQPALDDGIYRVTSALDVRDTTAQTVLAAPPEQVGHIRVTGPRFILGPEEIAGCHPPLKASGAFAERLPHVVLGRRTLPWERDGTPWMALLVLRADEASLVSGTLGTSLPAAVVTALEGVEPIDGDPQVTLLKVKDPATFQSVLPARTEMGLLTHVRQVNIADSALAGSDDDGWFAVVTANRLPLLAADGKDTDYLACLVSLEERSDAWTAMTGQPPALVVLFSWSFTSTASGGTFEHLARQLDSAPFGAPVLGQTALLDESGTVSLDRVDRQGYPLAVRYRSPLLGLADGIQLDSGADNITVSAAFELGRLLAAADERFTREMIAWHRATEAAARTPHLVERALAVRMDRTIAPAVSRPVHPTQAGSEILHWVREVANRPADLWRVHPTSSTMHSEGEPVGDQPVPGDSTSEENP
jgi:hypothetical protein